MMIISLVMSERYIHLCIDDSPFSTKVGLVPCRELPEALAMELGTMKAYEHLPMCTVMEQGIGYTKYMNNLEIPESVHQNIRKWRDLIEGKPHVIGPEYMDMSMDEVDDFGEYKIQLHNNLPEWYKNMLSSEYSDPEAIREITADPERIQYKIFFNK